MANNKNHKSAIQDKDLFKHLTKDVKPLHYDKHIPTRSRATQKQTKDFSIEDEQIENNFYPELQHVLHADDYLWYADASLSHKQLKQLKNGLLTLEDQLDLHGLNVNQSHIAFEQFFKHCQRYNLRRLLIIHGKSSHSHHRQAIIKSHIYRWLQDRSDILAFCSAIPKHGGTGSLYVLRKRK